MLTLGVNVLNRDVGLSCILAPNNYKTVYITWEK